MVLILNFNLNYLMGEVLGHLNFKLEFIIFVILKFIKISLVITQITLINLIIHVAYVL